MDSFKLAIYLEVLRLFKKDLLDEELSGETLVPLFVCQKLRDQIRDMGVPYHIRLYSPDVAREFFKELVDLCELKDTDGAWWSPGDIRTRIRCLEYIIEHRL